MTLSQTGWEPQPCQCPRPRVHEFGEANSHYLIQRRLEKGPECRTWSSEWEMDLLQGLVRSPVGLGQHFLSLLAVGCRIPNDILKSYWWGWPLMMWLLRHFRFINEMVQSLIGDVPATDPGLGNPLLCCATHASLCHPPAFPGGPLAKVTLLFFWHINSF